MRGQAAIEFLRGQGVPRSMLKLLAREVRRGAELNVKISEGEPSVSRSECLTSGGRVAFAFPLGNQNMDK